MNDVVVDGYLPDTRATEEMEDLGTTNIFIPACQCWGSVTFWCGSGSPDLYLLLMDPDPDPPPYPYLPPDPTPFFIDFILRMQKKYFFSYFFLQLVHRHIIFSLKNLIFCYNFVLKCYLQALLQPGSTHV
jgi:hypothetical protein